MGENTFKERAFEKNAIHCSLLYLIKTVILSLFCHCCFFFYEHLTADVSCSRQIRCCMLQMSERCFLKFLRLFAVGGRDGSSCLRSMECFDPHTNKWSMCAPMAKRRGGVGVATYNNFLYAVGGHDAPASNHCSRLSDCVERSVKTLLLWRKTHKCCVNGFGLQLV